jgi:hypothetical protein
MSIEVLDYPYFALFCMGILKKMQKLEYLELLAVRNEENAWSLGILKTLMEDFDEERDRFPEGKMPNIRIVAGDTGEELAAMKEDGVWTGGFALYETERLRRREEVEGTTIRALRW